MIIDRDTFNEMTVRLKRASEATLSAARHLAILSNHDAGSEEHWAGTLDGLMAMNAEVCVLEKIMRAVLDANRQEEATPLLS